MSDDPTKSATGHPLARAAGSEQRRSLHALVQMPKPLDVRARREHSLSVMSTYTLSSVKGQSVVDGGIDDAVAAAIEMEATLQPSYGVTITENGEVITEVRDGFTTEDRDLADELSSVANEEGTIQAADMVGIAPANRPELHTTTSVASAFRALTGRDYDPEILA